MKKQDEEERETLIQDHTDWLKDQNLKIYNIKDELDSTLSNPNMIA